MPLPRKFFIKHRGFGPTHGRADLPSFRRLFLRCALGSAERAMEVAPFSVECATLRACILSLLTTLGAGGAGGAGGGGGGGGGAGGGGGGGGDGGSVAKKPKDATLQGGDEAARWERQLSRACAACRHAIRLHDRRGANAGDFETRILHSPGGGGEGDNDDDGGGGGGGGVGEAPPATGSGSGSSRVESLRSMAAYAAHTLAERRGGWDFETSWVREFDLGTELGGGGAESSADADAGAGAGAAGGDDVGGGGGSEAAAAAAATSAAAGGRGGGEIDAVTAGVVLLAVDTEEGEVAEEEEEGAEEVAGWDMWGSKSILSYSLDFLRERRTW
jgi:hypothetical protein